MEIFIAVKTLKNVDVDGEKCVALLGLRPKSISSL